MTATEERNMSKRGFYRLFWTGAVCFCFGQVLFGDTAAGLRAFQNKDYATARREWSEAADRGQAEAQYNLGMLYLKGLGVARNPEEAFRWFRLAGEQGQADAAFQVGLMREKGVGVAQDFAQAQVWFTLAAEHGDSEAEVSLAELYDQGQGVPKDLTRAVYWYKMAAEQGLPEAQSRLGACYANGKGVHKDQVMAYFWLTLAAKRHDQNAEKQRLELAPRLSADEIAKTELSAAQWKPKPVQGQPTTQAHY
jgi:TPR repeat protein